MPVRARRRKAQNKQSHTADLDRQLWCLLKQDSLAKCHSLGEKPLERSEKAGLRESAKPEYPGDPVLLKSRGRRQTGEIKTKEI